MSNRCAVSLAGLLLLAPFTAKSEHACVDIERRLTADQLRATGLDSLTPAQLELLNRLLRAQSGDVGDGDISHETGATELASVPGDSKETRPEKSIQDPNRFVGFDDGPIKSRLKGVIDQWAPGTVFELENGQKWQVMKGSARLRETLTAPEILVVPGVAGRWFLQVLEGLPKARVYRIE